MKNFKYALIVIITVIFNITSFSQSLLEIISNPNTSYFEKINYIETNRSPLLDSAEDWELKRYDRWVSFWDTRIDNKGSYSTYLNAIGNYQLDRSSNEKVWETLGPKMRQLQDAPTPNDGWEWVGRAQSVWVNPADTSEIYLGSSYGGLWKTNNGGINWRLLTEEYAFGVNKIVVHPDNPDIMFIVTGNYANSLLN